MKTDPERYSLKRPPKNTSTRRRSATPDPSLDRFTYTGPTNETILKTLRESPYAEKDLKVLVREGCDQGHILFLLLSMKEAATHEDTWQRITGMERKQFKKTLGLIRKCAEQIKTIGSSKIINKIFQTNYRMGNEFLHLPLILEQHAGGLEGCIREFSPRKKPEESALLKYLVNYVKRITKAYHDEEIAGLLSVVLGKEDFGAAEQRAWRRRRKLYAASKSSHK